MLRVSCLNVENPENQADQFWASLPKIQIYHYILYTLYTKDSKIDQPGSQDFQHLDN